MLEGWSFMSQFVYFNQTSILISLISDPRCRRLNLEYHVLKRSHKLTLYKYDF